MEHMSTNQEVVIVSGARTALTNYGGAFKDIPMGKLASKVIAEAIRRAQIGPEQVDFVILGHVMTDSTSPNVARLAMLHAGLPISTPAKSIDIQCGSGLEAINECARKIRLGEGEIMVAGGVEIMSSAPYLSYHHRWGARIGDTGLVDYFGTLSATVSSDLYGRVNMADTSDNLARKYGITRREQDELALLSNQRAVQAMRGGKFKGQIVPIEIPQRKGQPLVIDTDEHPREDTSLEKLSKLTSPFGPESMVTAGNASGINDGAAALVVMSGQKAQELGIKPMARVVSFDIAAVHPTLMGWGPIPATEKALEKAGLKLEDMDLIELNEAFAGQALAVIKGWGKEKFLDRINVNGGAIALGHPVGATGSILMIKLLYELERIQGRYGLASLCCGGGLGVSTIVERWK